ncbi:MAG TPA: hypothetical protein VJA21_12620 [Verrucomicrobiae bacterium]
MTIKRQWPLELVAAVAACAVATLPSCSNSGHQVTKADVEKAHGLTLPADACNFQQRHIGGIFDKGVLSLFEASTKDVQPFIAQLSIRSRTSPAKKGIGDPRVNGWNVWPTNSPTFVPGNDELAGLKPTWTGEATPIEMLSCGSPKGDWLHVEIWSVGNRVVVKLYTDWN